MGFGLSDVFGVVANPGQFWGTNDLIGGAMNDITGASNSAQTQYKNSLKLQKDAQEFAKWQMQNAHQTEVADLEAAGLNPVLSANSGASAGVSANSAGTGSASTDPIAMIGSIVNMVNSAKKTNAEVNSLNNAAENLTNKTNAEVNNINADTKLTNTENKNRSTKTTAAENAEKAAKSWWGRNISPYLADIGQIFGGAGSGAIAGAAVANARTSAKKAAVKPKNKIGF